MNLRENGRIALKIKTGLLDKEKRKRMFLNI
jgi:hypothetical protein